MTIRFKHHVIICIYLALAVSNALFTTWHGKYPVNQSHSKMESFRFLAVILSWILSGTIGNQQHSASLDYKFTINFT